MGSLSRLSEKCYKCDRVQYCRVKRMESCVYMNQTIGSNLIQNNSIDTSAGMMNEPHMIDIHLASNTVVSVSIEEITKQLTKSLSVNCSAFNR